jgi:DNA-binding NarL/FixJ family response regulator
MYTPIKIVVADDHDIFREGFRLLLKDQSEVELAGEAENGRRLIELVDATVPDVVITDIKMPLIDGVEACRVIRQSHPHIHVIALTNFNEYSLIVDMLEAGAKGYLLKNTNRNDLIQAVKAVHAGNTYYCAAASDKLTQIIAESRLNPYRSRPKPEFTDRELELMRLICQQYTSKEIATIMHVSVRTIEGWRERIQEKTGLRNAVGIALYAVKKGFVKIEDLTFNTYIRHKYGCTSCMIVHLKKLAPSGKLLFRSLMHLKKLVRTKMKVKVIQKAVGCCCA